MEATTKIDNLFIHVKDYAEERLKLIHLNVHDKVSGTLSDIASVAVLFVVGLFTLLFLSIALAWWIGKQMNEPFLGFLIVSGIYLLVTIVIYANRDSWIRMPVINAFLKNITDEKD